MKIPLNRLVAFVKPYADLAGAALAAFLVAKVNLLGIPGLDQGNTATWVSGALVYAFTHGALALGNWQWLKGHHIQLEAAGRNGLSGDLVGTAVTTDETGRPADPPKAA